MFPAFHFVVFIYVLIHRIFPLFSVPLSAEFIDFLSDLDPQLPFRRVLFPQRPLGIHQRFHHAVPEVYMALGDSRTAVYRQSGPVNDIDDLFFVESLYRIVADHRLEQHLDPTACRSRWYWEHPSNPALL